MDAAKAEADTRQEFIQLILLKKSNSSVEKNDETAKGWKLKFLLEFFFSTCGFENKIWLFKITAFTQIVFEICRIFLYVGNNFFLSIFWH